MENKNEEIKNAIRKELEGTEYEVSSLTPLSGGTANFIYLARLHKPLSGGVREVVLKHGEAYVALHPDFKLEMVRCVSYPVLKYDDARHLVANACEMRLSINTEH